MKTLSSNWLTEKHIDFEYKKYMLLAYFSEVKNQFNQNYLYPHLSEIIDHYKNVVSLKNNKRLLSDSFPVQLRKIDLESFNLEYQRIIEDDSLLGEVEKIIDYSIPKFEYYLKEGKRIFKFIEEHVTLMPVGIVPLNPEYGYLLLRNGGHKMTYVFEYQTTIFEGPEERYRGIHTSFLDTYQKNISTTYEFIKSDLLKRKKELPNPATYVLESELNIPLHETLLPVAKRLLMRHLSEAA